jgi:hypothetical protein
VLVGTRDGAIIEAHPGEQWACPRIGVAGGVLHVLQGHAAGQTGDSVTKVWCSGCGVIDAYAGISALRARRISGAVPEPYRPLLFRMGPVVRVAMYAARERTVGSASASVARFRPLRTIRNTVRAR